MKQVARMSKLVSVRGQKSSGLRSETKKKTFSSAAIQMRVIPMYDAVTKDFQQYDSCWGDSSKSDQNDWEFEHKTARFPVQRAKGGDPRKAGSDPVLRRNRWISQFWVAKIKIMDPSKEKAAEWKSKMKKGDILVTIQNTTNFRLELTNSILREGKFFKKSEAINTVLPMGIEEMGIASKSQGEFVWQLAEAEPGLNQLRLVINSKDTTAKCDEVPASASWQVDLQQAWQKAPAHILLTLLNRTDPEPFVYFLALP
jgi:hypothetical protein